MRSKHLLGLLGLLLLTLPVPKSTAQTFDYSFAVVGCNRVDYLDTAATTGTPNATGLSTANVYQLKRMFAEVAALNPKPKYLFLTGDMVMGYINDTVALATQLRGWKAIYYSSPIAASGIKVVVIPGNHETQDKAAGKKSFIAAERTFLREMDSFIVGSNGPGVGGADGLATDQSKLTYSFNNGCDHFIILNTDPVGKDSRVPYKWLASDIQSARGANARHIFAFGHKPAYSSPFKPLDGLEAFVPERDSFWKYMENYNADAMFAAHEHIWDTIHPHAGKTWQVIAGNGGSLVETTWMGAGQSYFGFTLVNLYKNNQVNINSYGRQADMTKYSQPQDSFATSIRANFNIGIDPVIDHTPVPSMSGQGPFTITATITDDIAVTGARLNYFVNGITQTPITPVISGSTYTFTIPAVSAFSGTVNYNIQANDASGINFYSSGCATTYHTFTFYNAFTGPTSSQAPYVVPTIAGAKTTSVLTATDLVGGYMMAGIPDGLGAFDNGDGTFTLLTNHEIPNTSGVTRAHGSIGSFVSKWRIRKSDLTVLSGSDLMQNVKLWNGAGYNTYNSSSPSPLAIFGRFCAADLPAVSAFYNAATGKGTQERIFMNGEETNDESRAMAHIVTGPNGGTSYELPWLGKAAWENAVAAPNTGDKTVVGLMNDGTDGQVYFYIGTKTNTGTEIDKAGLNGGHPWAVKVTGFPVERVNSTTINLPPAPGTRFSLVDIGDVHNISGTIFNTITNAAGGTKFSRPEDGSWDPSHPNDFYFNTTDQLDQVNDGIGTQVGRSKVWRLRFDDVTNPELGGTIEAVIDGTEGIVMLDNMTIDKYGHIIMQEDVGNAAHNGKMWQYTIATDSLKMIAKHDPLKFGDIGLAATAPFTIDEETSGIIDMQDILGPGIFLSSDQAHYSISGAAFEGGQLFTLFNPDTYNSFVKTAATGPSTTKAPYVIPVATGATTTAVLTAQDTTSAGYMMAGIPDGLGAFDNGDGTFTLLMNHEIPNTSGVTRAHGSIGSFVSKWRIRKSDLTVLSGSDLMQNVKLWNGTGYNTYNSSSPSPLAIFGRFCAADLPAVSAFYNVATGKGTQERIFMNGEETNDESRAMAHIVTGPNGGTSYELPWLGKAAWENAVAAPNTGDKTVVGLMNDGTDGQVYFYIGTKTNTGTEIDKAGLNGGHPWAVKVTGFPVERVNSTTINLPPAPGTRFSLVDMGDVHNMTGAAFNTATNTAGGTKFSRPEDGSWDPSHPNDFYFNTTDQLDQVNDGIGTQVGRSKIWRLRFDNVTQPELGGTIEAVLDGTEGIVMLDNMTIDKYGHILMQEDVGNASHNGKIWQYTIATDSLKMITKHDPLKFGDIGLAATAPYTIDEETSGIIDMQDILGPGIFLSSDQAHYLISGAAYEGGQLFTLFNPDTYNSFIKTAGTGPSTTKGPYVLPVQPGVTTTAVLTAQDTTAAGYMMAGIPDGLGAFDNGDGTFTLLMNHEIPNTSGVTRAHGSIGSFVSKWKIRKSDLAVMSGSDLMQNVKLWNGAGYNTYNSSSPSPLAIFGRFCAADLPAVSAFYNAATGKGTQERIFMNGEETNDESRAMAHIVTGPNGGTSYELPWMGKAAWENAVAAPNTGDKTVVGLMNDGTDGQVYFYIGAKTNTGTEIDKAGLNGGHPWAVKVAGFPVERVNSTTINLPPAPGTRFSLVDIGDMHNISGAIFNTITNAAGGTKFSRPEDGSWDPIHPNDFYFNTTDQLDQVNDGIGTQVGRSKVWRLRFDDVTNPEIGGTIEAVLDGTEGIVMLDNMTIDKYGHIIMQEDVGNAAHNGKIWEYTIATDSLKMIAKHDPLKFGDIGLSATAPYSIDEETSGIIDMQEILGPGVFLSSDQAHYSISGAAFEGGQLFKLFNPDTCLIPEFRVTPAGIVRNGCDAVVTYTTSVVASPAAGMSYAFSGATTGSGIGTGSGTTFNIGITNVTITASNMCGSKSTTFPVTVNPLPNPVTVTGGGAVCVSGLLNASNGGSGTIYFQGTISGGTSTALATTTQGVTASGTYYFRAQGSDGCWGPQGSATVTVNPMPTAVTVSGSGTYCDHATITASNGSSGTMYFQGTLSGGISTAIPATSQLITTSGTYYFRALSAAGCWGPSGSAAVVINPLPTAYTLTGGGSYCATGAGVDVALSGSQTGVSYQLYNGTLAVAGPLLGTGLALDFGMKTATGIYTVVATNTISLCSNVMLGQDTVSVNPLPTVYTVTGGGTYCAGGTGVHIGLSGSETGIRYQLYVGLAATGAPVAGTGSALDFGLQTAPGSYTVVAHNTTTLCQNNMAGGASVSLNALPIVYNVVGGGHYCAGGSGLPVTLNSSNTGINYQLFYGGVATGSPIAGGAGTAINFGTYTSAGVYTVVATNITTGCTNTMAGSATIVIDSLPATFNVTGGGNYCIGGTGVHIGLGGSATGISYRLYKDGLATGAAMAGTGTTLDFGLNAAIGNYTVKATNTATGCMKDMTGSVNVGTNPLPVQYTVTGGGNYCAGGAGLLVGLNSSHVATNYQLLVDGVPTGTLLAGTGSALSFGLRTTAGNYAVYAVNTVTTCGTVMTGSVNISVTPLVNPSVSVTFDMSNPVCHGSLMTFTAHPVNGGIAPTYRWKLNSTNTGVISSTYHLMPVNGDKVDVDIISSETCINASSPAPTITIDVDTPITTNVTITAAPGIDVNPGQLVTLTAHVTTNGLTPTYRWFINSVPVAGATSATYASSSFANHDSVACTVTTSNGCGVNVARAAVRLGVGNVSIPGVTIKDELAVIPNPNKGAFNIEGTMGSQAGDEEYTLELTNMLGQVVHKQQLISHNGNVKETVQVNNNIANGMYILSIRSESKSKVFHIVIEK